MLTSLGAGAFGVVSFGGAVLPARPFQGADAGSGADAEAVAVALSSADVGVAVDAHQPVAAWVVSTDTAHGLDEHSLRVWLISSDAATAADGQSLAVLLVSSDFGFGTESQSLLVAVMSSDVGFGTEGLENLMRVYLGHRRALYEKEPAQMSLVGRTLIESPATPLVD